MKEFIDKLKISLIKLKNFLIPKLCQLAKNILTVIRAFVRLCKNNPRETAIAGFLLFLVLIVVVSSLAVQRGGIFSSAPSVVIETPDKLSSSNHEQFSLKLSLSSLNKGIYPAASFSIDFDSSKLIFLGVEEGNLAITDIKTTAKGAIPQWSVNVDKSNELGKINIMYLDITGGTAAFSDELVNEGENIVLYLDFQLRNSATKGDILELAFEDAVFAAVDETQSLASSNGTLKTKNGRIVVGD